MDIWYVFTGFVISVVEILIFSFMFPRKLTIRFVDNTPVAVVYQKCPILPLLTIVKCYNNLQKAFIRSRYAGKYYGTVYDLVLLFPDKTKELFCGEQKESVLLKYCKKINDALFSFKNYEVTKGPSIITTIYLLLALFILPFLMFCVMADNMNEEEKFCMLISTIVFFILFLVIGLIINVYKNKSAKNNSSVNIYFNKNEHVEIDSESKRINDSIIK